VETENENAREAKVFKAFCDENRVAILKLLRNGEKCACKLQDALGIGQSTLSHHMKTLCEAGMVKTRRKGKWAYYSLDAAGRMHALALLAQMTECNSNEPDTDCADETPTGTVAPDAVPNGGCSGGNSENAK